MASARDEILASLAGFASAPEASPGDYRGPCVDFSDPVAHFGEMLAAAGGGLVVLADADALAAFLDAEVSQCVRVVSGLPERASTTPIAAPRDAPPDLALLRGGPAVAESGAVWWCPADEQERSAAFLAERVILVVSAADLVDHLHLAYARIEPAAAPYGAFLCGPSKTADIEQALVIGAHGPRALQVALVGVPPSPQRDPG